MRSIGKKLFVAVFALAFAVAIPASASGQVSVAAAAGIFGFTGDLDGLDAGFGAEGAVGFWLSESISLAGVFHWSSHGISDTDVSISQIAIMAQPMIHFGEDGSTDFWVGARGGYTSFSDIDADGLLVGPMAGVGFPISDNATIGVGGTYTFLSLSDDVSGGGWGGAVYFATGLGGG